MKKNRRLIKLVYLLLKESFLSGRQNSRKVVEHIKTLKKLPTSWAIFALEQYLKGYKQLISKNTLVIESANKLSSKDIEQIKRRIKRNYQYSLTEVKVNPTLLGGIRIKIGDLILEDSYLSGIDQLKGVIIS